MRVAIVPLLLTALLAGCVGPTPAEFWRDYTNDVRAAGYMRAERSPSDAPIDAERVVRSFETIAFSFESDPFDTGADVDVTPMIRKWLRPIGYSLIAEDDDLDRLRRVLNDYVADLQGLTGHEIGEIDPQDEDGAPPNVFVIFGRDSLLITLKAYDDLADAGLLERDSERAEALELLGRVVAPWYEAPSPCAGQVFLGDGTEETAEGEVLLAIVMIRSEIPPPLLQACVEEEIAQLLGLFDDDDSLRPSIFNDDQEFALLTELDRRLLRILYDARLDVGMTPAEAMPIVRRISSELTLGG